MQNLLNIDSSTGEVDKVNSPILLTSEFKALKKKTKKLYSNCLLYIYLKHSWSSPYVNYTAEDREFEALGDSEIDKKLSESQEMKVAEAKFLEVQNSDKSVQLLIAARTAVDQFVMYFTHVVDLAERDAKGKPVFTADKVMKEVSMLTKVHTELVELENRVKQEIGSKSNIRAGATEGFQDD